MQWLLQVLEMLIAEDDTVPEVWYLLGLALHAGGDFDEALTAAAEAERLVSRRRHEDPGAGETLLDIEDLKVFGFTVCCPCFLSQRKPFVEAQRPCRLLSCHRGPSSSSGPWAPPAA